MENIKHKSVFVGAAYVVLILLGFLIAESHAKNTETKRQMHIEVYLEGLFNHESLSLSPVHDFINGVPFLVYDEGIADEIVVSLHGVGDYSIKEWGDLMVFQKTTLINKNGEIFIELPNEVNGVPLIGEFWLSINHRNHIETIFYQTIFIDDAATYHYCFISGGPEENYAFANNQHYLGEIFRNGEIIHGWSMYAGDLNGNGLITLVDYDALTGKMRNGIRGYKPEDLDGDGLINIRDRSIFKKNYLKGVATITPADK